MARYAVEVGMMCYTLAVGMKLGVIVILSLAKDLSLAVGCDKDSSGLPSELL